MRTGRLLTVLQIASIIGDVSYAATLDADAQALNIFVRDYVAERGADLLGTLRAFTRNNADPTSTAPALKFHMNTTR